MDFLKEMLPKKMKNVERRKLNLPVEAIKGRLNELPPKRDFKQAINKPNGITIIAEMKKSSPSGGLLRADYDVSKLAQEFQSGGADAISVLTDEVYFQGDLMHILDVKSASELPVLRKDFIIDEYQIYESRYFFADAILLIVKLLSDEELDRFYKVAVELGLDVVVEVESEEDVKRALKVDPQMIGINNRNLQDLKVNIMKPFYLRKLIPEDKVTIVESGIKDRDYIRRLSDIKVNSILIGEALMRSQDVVSTIRMFKNECLKSNL